jgi:NAD-dependent DNA ligase
MATPGNNRIVGALGKDLRNVEKFPPHDLHRFVAKADAAYFNSGTPLIPDALYDHVRDYLSKLEGARSSEGGPSAGHNTPVGADVPDGRRKVDLPVYMGSLRKVKDDTDLEKFCAKAPSDSYLISDKLDGVSGLLLTENGKLALYTRGNGRVGEDASFLLDYMDLPKKLPVGSMIRGELIISRADFDAINKLGNDFKNPRNLVSGAVNSVKSRRPEVLERLQFVAYEVISAERCLAPSQQMRLLADKGFAVVPYTSLPAPLSAPTLSATLYQRRKASPFDIDGVVVSQDAPYARATDENPRYAAAFKDMSMHDRAETLVTKVAWDVSKDGFLKPTVYFEPVQLSGVTISKATGFNAKYVVDNSVGPGAKVLVVRSGEVIPHILEVTAGAALPMLPDLEYEWNESGVDIRALGECDELKIKLLAHFFSKLDARGVSIKTIAALYHSGFDTIPKIAKLTADRLAGVPGFKDKSAANVVRSIAKSLQDARLSTLLVASNVFGRGLGERKVDALLAVFPQLLERRRWGEITVAKVRDVDGFAAKTAEAFVQKLPDFGRFLDDNELRNAF